MSISGIPAPTPSARWRSATIALLVVAVLLGGGLAYEAANDSSLRSKYNHLNNEYQTEVQNYSALQSTSAQRLSALNGTANQYGVLADAYAHWDAIAARNLTATMAGYSSSVVLDWVGGPLNGTYRGPSNVSGVWTHFLAGSSAIWWSTIAPVSVSMGTDVSTVNATLQFTLTSAANPLDITYVDVAYSLGFTYASGSWWIATEVWGVAGHGDLTSQAAYALSLAYAHWNAIAIENTSLLGPQYASTAVLHWIGGPLAGTYTGVPAITGTWSKFFAAWSAVWFYAEAPPVVSVTGASATVSAVVQFPLTPSANPTSVQALTINYTLTLAATSGGWTIQEETWDIVGGASLVDEPAYLTSLAFTHWDGIVGENLTSVLGQYAATSSLDWIGGALNGVYNGTSALSGAWSSFFTAWNGGLWFSTTGTPTVTLGPTGGNVNATIEFVANSTAGAVNTTSLLTVDSSLTYSVSPTDGHWTLSVEVFHVVGTRTF